MANLATWVWLPIIIGIAVIGGAVFILTQHLRSRRYQFYPTSISTPPPPVRVASDLDDIEKGSPTTTTSTAGICGSLTAEERLLWGTLKTREGRFPMTNRERKNVMGESRPRQPMGPIDPILPSPRRELPRPPNPPPQTPLTEGTRDKLPPEEIGEDEGYAESEKPVRASCYSSSSLKSLPQLPPLFLDGPVSAEKDEEGSEVGRDKGKEPMRNIVDTEDDGWIGSSNRSSRDWYEEVLRPPEPVWTREDAREMTPEFLKRSRTESGIIESASGDEKEEEMYQ